MSEVPLYWRSCVKRNNEESDRARLRVVVEAEGSVQDRREAWIAPPRDLLFVDCVCTL
jgi:hypothetical protein